MWLEISCSSSARQMLVCIVQCLRERDMELARINSSETAINDSGQDGGTTQLNLTAFPKTAPVLDRIRDTWCNIASVDSCHILLQLSQTRPATPVGGPSSIHMGCTRQHAKSRCILLGDDRLSILLENQVSRFDEG
ncbi:hypothetical protein E4T47_03714 [Aureobasidium subglaciale]|nr:hypothetical protein E4T43_03851 [Aureobasidium subglaciale]KAI5273068.1 hypothetical protein E4T47_03714 [Aureobasidium subglaciale]